MAAAVRKSWGKVTAVVALVVAAGVGGARAGDLIGPRDIRDNAVRTFHLKFPLGFKGQFKSAQVTSTGGTQTLLEKTFRLPDRGVALPVATVEVMGNDAAGAVVQFRLTVDGKQVGGIYEHSVAQGQLQTITIPLPNPDELVQGSHTFTVQALAGKGDATFRDRQLNVVMSPTPMPSD